MWFLNVYINKEEFLLNSLTLQIKLKNPDLIFDSLKETKPVFVIQVHVNCKQNIKILSKGSCFDPPLVSILKGRLSLYILAQTNAHPVLAQAFFLNKRKKERILKKYQVTLKSASF